MYSHDMTIDQSNPTDSARASRTRGRLALGAVVGPVLFTFAWVVLGIVSPGYTFFGHRFTDYSPISQPISGLGMGSTGPYMNAAFICAGLILVAGVVGVFRVLPPGRPVLRRWSAALLACTGIGQVICGIFNLEAMMLHNLGVGLAIGTPVISFLVAGQYFRGLGDWRRFGTWLLLASPLTLALLVAFFATFQPTIEGAEHGIAGLVQRVLALEVLGWFAAMGWLAYRRNPIDARPAKRP
jgi:Protein of unknown function (DUF998)